MMSDSEIDFMKQTVMKMMRNSDVWNKAFVYYNQNNEKKLGMGCRPCYGKVLNYCIQAKKLSDNKISTNPNNASTNDFYL